MEKHEFLDQLSVCVNDYIDLSQVMCGVLAELKTSFLAFDTYKINKLLDEKLVVSEQILEVNKSISSIMIDLYGEFSKSTSMKLLEEFPEIKQSWQQLQGLASALETELSEVKRVLNMIENYDFELLGVYDEPVKAGLLKA